MRLAPVLFTLAAGALVALQPPANAALAKQVGYPGAAFVSLVISTVLVGGLMVATGHLSELRGLSGFRAEHVLGGVAGAAIVLVTLVSVRSLGAAGVTAAVVAAQLAVSVLVDRLGVLGLERVPLSPTRLVAIALLVGGTLLITR